MSFANAAFLAALSGLVTGGISALLSIRSRVRSSVVATALIGALLATVAFGVFLIPGYLVALMLFTGTPSPSIALLCTVLAELIWIVFAAIRSS
jgi:uncharacterized membrane protein (GlpM family)